MISNPTISVILSYSILITILLIPQTLEKEKQYYQRLRIICLMLLPIMLSTINIQCISFQCMKIAKINSMLIFFWCLCIIYTYIFKKLI